MLVGYGGTPRSGKTYSAIKDWYLPTIIAGVGKDNFRPIYTNIDGLLDESCLFATAEYTGASVQQIVEQVHIVNESWFLNIAQNCPDGALVLADEAHIYWCSREWKSFTDESRNWFAESGRKNVDIVWISQTQSSIEKWITGRTEYIHNALNLAMIGMPKRFVLRTRTGDSKTVLSSTHVKIEEKVYKCYKSFSNSNPYATPKKVKTSLFSKSFILFILLIFGLVAVWFGSNDKKIENVSSTLPTHIPTHHNVEDINNFPTQNESIKSSDSYILGLLNSTIIYEGFAQIKNDFIGYVSFVKDDTIVRLSFLDLQFLGIDYMVPSLFSHYIKLSYEGSDYLGFTQAPKGYDIQQKNTVDVVKQLDIKQVGLEL